MHKRDHTINQHRAFRSKLDTHTPPPLKTNQHRCWCLVPISLNLTETPHALEEREAAKRGKPLTGSIGLSLSLVNVGRWDSSDSEWGCPGDLPHLDDPGGIFFPWNA